MNKGQACPESGVDGSVHTLTLICARAFASLMSYNLLVCWTTLEGVLEGCGKHGWAFASLGGMPSGG